MLHINDSGTTHKYREVVVVPLAARREALALFAVIVLIVLLMAVRFSAVSTADTEVSLKVYQKKDNVLKNQAPTLYRSLRGVVGDIVDLREEIGQWPDIDMLEGEALPPFADKFLPAALRGYVWSRHVGKGWVDYFGINRDVAAAEKEGIDPLEDSFMLRIIDLHSKEHPHPHLGRDDDAGMRFSYQIWMYPGMRKYPQENVLEKGWKWIVGSTDFDTILDKKISEKPGE